MGLPHNYSISSTQSNFGYGHEYGIPWLFVCIYEMSYNVYHLLLIFSLHAPSWLFYHFFKKELPFHFFDFLLQSYFQLIHFFSHFYCCFLFLYFGFNLLACFVLLLFPKVEVYDWFEAFLFSSICVQHYKFPSKNCLGCSSKFLKSSQLFLYLSQNIFWDFFNSHYVDKCCWAWFRHCWVFFFQVVMFATSGFVVVAVAGTDTEQRNYVS